jgi:hypothetical protein
MASDTRNVKLGVCQVFFDGEDLGYTKGGVEVEVKTEVYKVTVDQFGKTPINQNILGREVMVKVPLAETTLDNLVKIMPGATLVSTGGVKAAGEFTFTANPANNETITINGKTVTFKTSAATGPLDVLIGANLAATMTAAALKLNASTDPAIAIAQYVATATKLQVTFGDFGPAGNTFALGAGTSGANVAVTAMTGGTNPTAERVEVPTGIGLDLLAIAKELRLHPVGKPESDKSDDFFIPLSSTPGGLQFAYQLEQERIFNVEFQGYPDPTTGRLFFIGSPE